VRRRKKYVERILASRGKSQSRAALEEREINRVEKLAQRGGHWQDLSSYSPGSPNCEGAGERKGNREGRANSFIRLIRSATRPKPGANSGPMILRRGPGRVDGPLKLKAQVGKGAARNGRKGTLKLLGKAERQTREDTKDEGETAHSKEERVI